MTAMAQPFTTHPGMAGHAGVSHGGQPMVHGHPSNQGVPGGHPMGASMGQQIHPGLVGPGGPQVSQGGPMMGLMPGGGPPGGVSGPTPSAHALSHLNPQPHHNQMFAGQQMPPAMANNPQLLLQQQQAAAQQQHQQRLLQQRMQQPQIQHNQQQQNGGMMPSNGNPSMNDAQYLLNNQNMGTPRVPLPPHLQQAQQQAQANQHAQQNARLQAQQHQHQHQQHQQHQQIQQQQQQQAQQQQAVAAQHQQQQQQQHQQQQNQQNAQQAQQQAQQAQRAQQVQQQQLAAQQMAMQHHAVSNAATTQGQPAAHPQMNPQSQIPTGPDPQAAAAAQRQAQQQAQMQHQHNQRQQEQQQQNQAAQQQQQQQQQSQPQQQQQQQSAPPQTSQGQQQQQQQQQPNPQQQQAQQQQVAQMQQQRQAAQAAAMMQQPHMQNLGGSKYIMKLHQFGSHLSQASLSPGPRANGRLDGQQQDRRRADDISYWQNFVDEFFSAQGILKQSMLSANDNSAKQFEISTPALARYYYLHFNSGIQNIQMFIDSVREKNLNGGIHILEANSTFIYWSRTGHQLVVTGPLKAQFDLNGKMDILDLVTHEQNEFIPRNTLVQAAAESPEIKQSPNTSKSNNRKVQNRQKQQQQQQQENQPRQVKIPESAFHEMGTTAAIWQFLELVETVSLMAPLFQHSHQRPMLPPSDVLSAMCNQFSNQLQQHHQPQQHQQLHQQNPQFNPAMQHPAQQPPHQQNLNAFQQNNFLSPAHAHLSLPNNNTNPSASPATLSNHPTPSMQNLALQNSMQQGGVPMAAQVSHQGTNLSAGETPGGSANASPSVTGKRRRPSGVGLGVGGGGEEVVEVNGIGGGNKVKQSPRPGQKRQKGN